MNRMILYFKNNKAELGILTLFFAIDLIYLSNTTANVPIMDYWRFGNDFLYDIFNGGMRFNDFWESINGQRAFLTYLLFFVNVRFFHWNTRIAIWGGSVATYITGLILLNIIKNRFTTSNTKTKSIVYYTFIISLAMILFNYVQWEMKIIEFAAPSSIIVLVIVLNMQTADNLLLNLKRDISKVLYFTLFLSISVCFVFSAFFPAVVGAICICGFHNFLTNYKTDKLSYLTSYIVVGVGILISSGLYLYGIEGIADSNNNIVTFSKYILKGDFLKGIAIYLGSSLVHVSTTEMYGMSLTIFIGCVIGLLYIICLYCGFKRRKIHEISYFPMMLILYALFVGILLSYGRGNVFDSTYLSSSRYAYQSKLGLIGISMIVWNTLKINKQVHIYKMRVIVKAVVPIFFILMLLYAQIVEFRISPYRRASYNTLIQYMYDIDNVEDEKLLGFQAETPLYVRKTIEYMKIYQLGIFHHVTSTEQMQLFLKNENYN